jgi:hypothetical protein
VLSISVKFSFNVDQHRTSKVVVVADPEKAADIITGVLVTLRRTPERYWWISVCAIEAWSLAVFGNISTSISYNSPFQLAFAFQEKLCLLPFNLVPAATG